MPSNRIIAITLGPIYRTTSNIKMTKALWASSYFFSYLAKKIIEPFKERNFILPLVADENLWKNNEDGIGRFPDKFIFYSQKDDFKLLQNTTNTVIKKLAEQIVEFFITNKKATTEAKVESFLKNYLKIYFFERECKTDNIVKECNGLLDLMEMQDTYNLCESRNYLTEFFEHIELRSSFLVKDAFGSTNKLKLFNTLEEISESDLRDNEVTERKAYHNYIAIISADGDNMSETIKKLLAKENEKAQSRDILQYQGFSVQELSKKLMQFGESIVPLKFKDESGVEWEYKARIIFLGGDDLLIFAPVMYKGKTVFDFIDRISKIFDDCMSSGEELEVKPTLSFGIAITYNKFPMSEALQMSHDLLDLAKNKEKHPDKNTIAFTLQKHSGQSNSGEIEKNTSVYCLFKSLISSYKPEDDKFLSSIIYWLGNHDFMIKTILTLSIEEGRNERLKNYFNNSFNEPVHEDMKTFYDTLINFLSEAQGCNDDPIKLLITTLRFIHFLKIKHDE